MKKKVLDMNSIDREKAGISKVFNYSGKLSHEFLLLNIWSSRLS
jgi:hypothetical protein